MVRLDMSEYMEKFNVSRLIGAPPGYVGYEEGGQLSERVRQKPYCVVLLDEIEKAHPDVFNLLLQVMDEGRLTDNNGRTVSFRNTIVICTANLGFDFAREGQTLGFSPVTAETGYERLKEKRLAEAKRTFRPELLNRFDETVVFRKLEKEDLAAILELELATLQARLEACHVKLTLDGKAKAFLVEKGTDSSLGARPLRRVVQDYVEDPLAELVLAGKVRARMRGKLAKDAQSIVF
jgi:ATP-dependent Clp protease ATP-binding subunit ClpC